MCVGVSVGVGGVSGCQCAVCGCTATLIKSGNRTDWNNETFICRTRLFIIVEVTSPYFYNSIS